jgi:hypothetical protein
MTLGNMRGVTGILRHVDQALVSARIAESGRDQPLHAEVAHVGWLNHSSLSSVSSPLEK